MINMTLNNRDTLDIIFNAIPGNFKMNENMCMLRRLAGCGAVPRALKTECVKAIFHMRHHVDHMIKGQ